MHLFPFVSFPVLLDVSVYTPLCVFKGAVEGTFSEIMQMLPITSGSLLLCCDGRICIGPSSSTDPPSKEFIPPEYGRSRNLTEEEVEKVS